MTLTLTLPVPIWRAEFRWRRFCKTWHTIGLVMNKIAWSQANR